jgi:hypothetical protein
MLVVEHQVADWRNGHKKTCKTRRSKPSMVKVDLVLQPIEKSNSIGMLELAKLFKLVHKNMPQENKEGALWKIIHVCELIVKQGNLDYKPLFEYSTCFKRMGK